ncbi:MAG: hypothetical protein DMG57_07305 [Acidobacteria bacterium]|nr:MAG: hypothetical protein DMG57_07305 [Acidobacteriota bacterium]
MKQRGSAHSRERRSRCRRCKEVRGSLPKRRAGSIGPCCCRSGVRRGEGGEPDIRSERGLVKKFSEISPSRLAKRLIGIIAEIVLFGATGAGQTPDASPFSLSDLPRLKTFTAHRASSNNRFVGSNDDSKRIMPGETLVMADLRGPGVVNHFWVTVADNEYAWPRLVRLRVYYDGKKTPSVDVPLGDFFGVGHGYERDLDSLPVRNSSFGRARNSYWPMPFRQSCKITVTNEGNRPVTAFYYHVDW